MIRFRTLQLPNVETRAFTSYTSSIHGVSAHTNVYIQTTNKLTKKRNEFYFTSTINCKPAQCYLVLPIVRDFLCGVEGGG